MDDNPSHSGVDAGVSPVKKNKKGKVRYFY